MTQTAILFAGQGAQSVGMGNDLAEQFTGTKQLFEQANEVLGYDLASICFNGPEEALTKTEHAQPGIYLVGWVAWQLLRDRFPNLEIQAAAGLSLGEFTALAAAGALSFEEGLRIVRERGRFMQEACDNTQGGMAAIIGLDETVTRDVCSETGVEIANLNCPGQIVISGPKALLEKACDVAKERGAKRALPLSVAGAYHSTLMKGAQSPLENVLAGVEIQTPKMTVIANVTAQPHGTPEDIRSLLVQQVTSSVRWEESVKWLLGQGVTRFIELGPGTALTGFLKRIDRSAQVLNVSDVASLEATAAALDA